VQEFTRRFVSKPDDFLEVIAGCNEGKIIKKKKWVHDSIGCIEISL
jgi:hypothetical protein